VIKRWPDTLRGGRQKLVDAWDRATSRDLRFGLTNELKRQILRQEFRKFASVFGVRTWPKNVPAER